MACLFFERCDGVDEQPAEGGEDVRGGKHPEVRIPISVGRKINGTQYLWASRVIGVTSTGSGTNADRLAVEWFKIRTTPSVSIADTGRIFDNGATSPKFYYFPSLAVNTNGDMLIGFSGSSTNSSNTNDLVAAYYWGKLHNGSSSSTPVRYFGTALRR